MTARSALFTVILVMASICQAVAAMPSQTYPDLPYASEDDPNDLQRLNLIVPERDEAMPLLIWIGGGAWSYVDRHQEMNLVQKIADSGIVVASVGHRLSPATWQDPTKTEGVQHPAHIEDIAAATGWLLLHSDEYKIDRNRVYVGGFSSGAHLAALLVSDPKYLLENGFSTDDIHGVIAFGGAYDIPDYHRAFAEGSRPHFAVEHVEAVFGSDREGMIAASPITYAEDLVTPMLLVSDRNTYNYTRLYEDALV
ncbi:MAG: alpha/beta hydrolase, partial [Pseudomonadota bacterium]